MRSTVHISLILLVLLLAACARVPTTLRPYTDQPPQQLLQEVDAAIYSPIGAGLESLRADLLVDVAGFYAEENRPDEPVWIPALFVYDRGRVRFDLPPLPPEIQPLEERLLATLQGKEEDILYRPFSQRLEDTQLEVRVSSQRLLEIHAVDAPENVRWVVTVDEQFRVPQLRVETPAGIVQSLLEYTDDAPALIRQIESRFAGDQQDMLVTVDIGDYREIDGYHIPHELTYTGRVNQLAFPPLTLRLQNVRVDDAARGNRQR